jgi:hypothetical protein
VDRLVKKGHPVFVVVVMDTMLIIGNRSVNITEYTFLHYELSFQKNGDWTLANEEGIEPSPRGLEALVLPLHHSDVNVLLFMVPER